MSKAPGRSDQRLRAHEGERRLNNGVEMPILGFGVFQIPPDDTERAVIATLDTGASLFFDHRDPAMVKWLNERQEPLTARGCV